MFLESLLEEKMQIYKIIEARLRQGMSIKPGRDVTTAG